MNTTTKLAGRTPSPKVDVCIIGAGIAGSICAHSLAKRGHSVVILEAGERFDLDNRHHRMEEAIRPSVSNAEVWNVGGKRDTFTSSGDLYYPLNETRVKGVGGTTLHWLGVCMRLHEKDFEMHSRYGIAVDWPIDYDDLKSYYADAETEMGIAGGEDNPFAPPREEPFPMDAFPMSHSDNLFETACSDLDIEVHSIPHARNSESFDGRSPCLGYSTCIPICPSGAKYSGDVHIDKAEAKGVRVIDRAPVQQLHHDNSGDQITAAEYVLPDGTTYRQTADQFVLAAGGIEIPRLLLLSSTSMYPDGLANSSGTVGHYFMEHPGVIVASEVDEPPNASRIGFHTSESHQFYDHNDPPPGSFRLEFWNSDPESPVYQALRGGDRTIYGDLTDFATGDEWGDDLVDAIEINRDHHRIVSKAGVEPLPRWDNTVTLDHENMDHLGNPVPDISWRLGEYEYKTLERAKEIQLALHQELGGTNITTSDPSDPMVGAHHIGTTRMGSDPSTSVVDSRCNSHDLSNLWITSSSVFPTAGAMAPTLTISAMTLKVADHIHEEL